MCIIEGITVHLNGRMHISKVSLCSDCNVHKRKSVATKNVYYINIFLK